MFPEIGRILEVWLFGNQGGAAEGGFGNGNVWGLGDLREISLLQCFEYDELREVVCCGYVIVVKAT